MEPSPNALTALDWLGVVVTWLVALGVLFFPAASYDAMFAEMGSRESLPVLTQLVTTWWFRFAAAAPPMLATLVSFRSSLPLARKRMWIVVAFVLALVGLGVSFVGCYLPIFALAGSIRAD